MIALFLSPSPYDSGGVCPRPTIVLLLEGYTQPQSLTVTGIVSVKHFSLNKDFSLLLWLPKGQFLWNWKEHSFKEVGKGMYFLLIIGNLFLAYGCHIFAKAPNCSYLVLSENCQQPLLPVEFKLVYLPPPSYFKENLYSLALSYLFIIIFHHSSLHFFSLLSNKLISTSRE